jgi:hypothetical protein
VFGDHCLLLKFSFCPLYCLSFFDLRLRVTLLRFTSSGNHFEIYVFGLPFWYLQAFPGSLETVVCACCFSWVCLNFFCKFLVAKWYVVIKCVLM